jgi:hypothetical protein
MLPDIEQHIGVMFGILLAIGETLRRLLKQRNRVRLALTLSVTEESSSDCPQNTNSKTDLGVKMDSKDAQQQPAKQQRDD